MSRLASVIWYHIGRFEMLIGIFSLGLATAILSLPRKNGRNQREPSPSPSLMVPLLASALNLYSKSKRGSGAKSIEGTRLKHD